MTGVQTCALPIFKEKTKMINWHKRYIEYWKKKLNVSDYGVLVTVFDLWVQIYGVKKFGGTKKAVNGSIIGLIIGIFFLPPFGIIIGPFLGALLGARMEENSDVNKAIKIALGALAGFLAGTMLKLSVSLYIIYLVFQTIPPLW